VLSGFKLPRAAARSSTAAAFLTVVWIAPEKLKDRQHWRLRWLLPARRPGEKFLRSGLAPAAPEETQGTQ